VITHIVLWKIKDQALGMNKPELISKLISKLESLPAAIPQILSLSAGANQKQADAASDVALYSAFASWEDLQTYQEHPFHQEVVRFVKEIVTERRVVDYSDAE